MSDTRGPRSGKGVRWAQRSALGGNGLRWWAAVLFTVVLTGIGVFIDLGWLDRLDLLFKALYFLGCVIAVVMVQRKGLFSAMVQPPIVLAVAVIGVVLATSGAPGQGGTSARLLAISAPLINGFPTMAITTGLVLLIGVLRLIRERRPRLARNVRTDSAPRSGTGEAAASSSRARAGRPGASTPERSGNRARASNTAAGGPAGGRGR